MRGGLWNRGWRKGSRSEIICSEGIISIVDGGSGSGDGCDRRRHRLDFLVPPPNLGDEFFRTYSSKLWVGREGEICGDCGRDSLGDRRTLATLTFSASFSTLL